MMTTLDEGMLGLAEAAQFVGVSETTILKYVRQGKLKAWKVANKTKFYKEDLITAFKRPIGDHGED